MLRSCVLSALAATTLLAGCGGGSSVSPAPPTPAPVPTNATTIKHIVIIMQENRSFDNLFNGFPGADTVQSGMSAGQSVTLQPVPFEQGTDVDHSHTGWWKDWDNGLMDGFTHPKVSYPTPNFPYAYVPQAETVPYWTLAKDYTLGDRMFQSNTGPSFVAHQYMIAGQSADADENPADSEKPKALATWGCDATSTTTVALLGPTEPICLVPIRASTTRRSATFSIRRGLPGNITPRPSMRAAVSGPPFRRFTISVLAPTGHRTSSRPVPRFLPISRLAILPRSPGLYPPSATPTTPALD